MQGFGLLSLFSLKPPLDKHFKAVGDLFFLWFFWWWLVSFLVLFGWVFVAVLVRLFCVYFWLGCVVWFLLFGGSVGLVIGFVFCFIFVAFSHSFFCPFFSSAVGSRFCFYIFSIATCEPTTKRLIELLFF